MPRLPLLQGEPAPVLPFRVVQRRQAAQLPAAVTIHPIVVEGAKLLQELVDAGDTGFVRQVNQILRLQLEGGRR